MAYGVAYGIGVTPGVGGENETPSDPYRGLSVTPGVGGENSDNN